MKQHTLSENELRALYIDFRSNNSKVQLFYEVPVLSRSVDLVEFQTMKRTITAIEFKLHDWKRAIEQAQMVSMAFDFIYICIPKPKTNHTFTQIQEACKSKNVGLIVYDEIVKEFETLIACSTDHAIWNTQKEIVVNMLEEKVYESANKNA